MRGCDRNDVEKVNGKASSRENHQTSIRVLALHYTTIFSPRASFSYLRSILSFGVIIRKIHSALEAASAQPLNLQNRARDVPHAPQFGQF